MNETKPFVERTLRWVGELDHPFYNDERQRFVWYEASAVGFQLMFLVNVFVLGAIAWIGGGPSLLYVYPMVVAQYVVVFVVLRYAKKKHAEYSPNAAGLRTGRTRLHLIVLVFLGTGLLRAQFDAGTGSGFVGGLQQGFAWGLASVPVLFAMGASFALRSTPGCPEIVSE